MSLWWFCTMEGTSGLKRVGFQCEYEDIVVNGEDWFLVRNIAQIPDDPNAVLLKFHSAKSEKGKQQLPNGKIKVKLGDYFSPAASPWAKLEDFHDPAAFIANFNEMRESIERDEDDEDSMGEGGKATNEESQVHSKGMEDFSVDGEHMAKGAEGESEGTMEGEDDTSDDEFDPKKPKLPSQKVTRKKPKHQETDPETEDEIHGDDGDQEEEVDQRKKKKKTKGSKGRKEKRQIEKCDFREAVEKMRQIHPDVDKVENNMPLNKNALGWRSAVADQQNSTLLNVSSLMATHVAVATLSPRCYQEAQGVMSLWSAGQCRGQGKSRNVKQTIFRELKGQHREEDLFDLLRQLRRGQIDWDDFETRAKAHKKRNRSTSATSATSAEAQKKALQLQEEVAILQHQKHQLMDEIEKMKREKNEIQDELVDLQKQKQQEQESRDQLQQANQEQGGKKRRMTEKESQLMLRGKRQKVGDTSTSTSGASVVENSWVGVWYERKGSRVGSPGVWYPGRVLEILPGGKIKIKFLQYDPSSPGRFTEPSTEDKQSVFPSFIIRKNLQVVEESPGVWKVLNKGEVDRACKRFKPPSRH
ncbi:uncharacterized protein LOC144860601 [Branchiostoma floridae x Branchiostoma japonicum]